MSLRTDLIPTIDAARGILDDLGLRVHVVHLRATTWSGDAPGRGTATHADTEITPPPKVGGPPRRRFDEPGGTAGSRFANDDRRASHAALMCVRFVADMVAMRARVT